MDPVWYIQCTIHGIASGTWLPAWSASCVPHPQILRLGQLRTHTHTYTYMHTYTSRWPLFEGGWSLIFLGGEGSQITADGDCSHEIKRLASWNKSYDQPRQHIKKQRHYFANKGPSSQSFVFSSSHGWM